MTVVDTIKGRGKHKMIKKDTQILYAIEFEKDILKPCPKCGGTMWFCGSGSARFYLEEFIRQSNKDPKMKKCKFKKSDFKIVKARVTVEIIKELVR